MKTQSFMEKTISAHNLALLTDDQAAKLAPSETALNFAVLRGKIEKPAPDTDENALFADRPFVTASLRARYLRDNTDWYEKKGYLVSENDYFYPSLKHFAKSFEKWLALQKHDVKAVNSLHEWHEAVVDKYFDVAAEIYELETAEVPPAFKAYLDAALEKKEAEFKDLIQLRGDLSKAIDKVKTGKSKTRQVA